MSVTRIATFNVENMFDRPKAMNTETWQEGGPILADHARLNELIQQDIYDDATKAEMLALLATLGTLGHVGFYWARSGDRILVLGGNQDNQVSIKGYPKADLLGHRWPD